jgi:hypothetical protein
MGGLKSEGIVQARSVVLSRFFVRCLEVAGAGVASAICAYVLGQIASPVAAPAPPQAVAQVALAAGDSVRVVQDAPAPLVEAAPTEPQMQKEPQTQKDEPQNKSESTAATPTTAPVPTAAPVPAAAHVPTTVHVPMAAPAPKPAKPTHTAQPRRHQKPEQTPVVEAKPRATEPLPIQPPVAAAEAAPKPAVQGGAPAAQSADVGSARDGSAAPAAKSGEDDRTLFAKLGLIPSWFSSGNDRPAERPAADVPRPPRPVGEF